MVQDIDRPDVNGVPPKMLKIAEKCKEVLSGLTPHMIIRCDDNIMSNISISGSFDPKEKWTNGIYENSRFFRFGLFPQKGQRYYTEGENIAVELCMKQYTITNKFRKYTGPVDKVIPKIVKWIEESSQEGC